MIKEVILKMEKKEKKELCEKKLELIIEEGRVESVKAQFDFVSKSDKK